MAEGDHIELQTTDRGTAASVKQPKLKSIRNMVIAEALKLGSYHILFEEEETGLEASNDWTEQEPEQVEE